MKSAFLFLSIFNIARVMLYYFTPQHVPVDVGIYFGCGDFLVSQHFLDSEQVGAAFQQMGGEGMAERMRAHVFFDTGHFRLLLDNMENHDPR